MIPGYDTEFDDSTGQLANLVDMSNLTSRESKLVRVWFLNSLHMLSIILLLFSNFLCFNLDADVCNED